MAYRYDALEREEQAASVHEIMEAIKLTGRFHGIKKLTHEPFERELGDTHDDDDDDDDTLILGGKGTAIE